MQGIFFFVLFVAVFSANQVQATSTFHVIIDPGHGGTDNGATYHAIKESDITLSVSKLVAEEFRKDKSFVVTLTRTTDVYRSLEERASFANRNGDIFLSIHANSSSDAKARGHEIYFQNQLPPDEESLFLASRENKDIKPVREVAHSVSLALKDKKNIKPEVRSIVEDLERNQHLKMSGLFAEKLYESWNGDRVHRRRSIRQAPFFVVSNIDKPAALIEIGYLSNKAEAQKLTDKNYQKRIAAGIYQAIVAFRGTHANINEQGTAATN